jgi:hypothetical protein
MKPAAMIFTRYGVTDAQLAEIRQDTIGKPVHLTELAYLPLSEWKTIEEELVKAANELAKEMQTNIVNVYGVFPTYLLSLWHYEHPRLNPHLHFFAAWNINHAHEGKKPKFSCKAWVLMGSMFSLSNRESFWETKVDDPPPWMDE